MCVRQLGPADVLLPKTLVPIRAAGERFYDRWQRLYLCNEIKYIKLLQIVLPFSQVLIIAAAVLFVLLTEVDNDPGLASSVTCLTSESRSHVSRFHGDV